MSNSLDEYSDLFGHLTLQCPTKDRRSRSQAIRCPSEFDTREYCVPVMHGVEAYFFFRSSRKVTDNEVEVR